MTHAAKQISHVALACSSAEFEQATVGHTPHFVSDRLTLLLRRWSPISSRDYLIWSQLMVRTRAYKNHELRISHRTLYIDAGVSEATMRDALGRLSLLGFIEIQEKIITPFGKNYVLRVAFPRHLLSQLKAELDRCRLKQGLIQGCEAELTNVQTAVKPTQAARHESPEKRSIETVKPLVDTKVKAFAPDCIQKSFVDGAINSGYKEGVSKNRESIIADGDACHGDNGNDHNDNAGTVYLSWEGKALSEQEAYLAAPDKPTLNAPYKPRQNRPDNWVPGLADLEQSLGLISKPPASIAEQHHLIDIMDWVSHLQLAFRQEAFKKSHCLRGFGWFLLHSPDLDALFSDHLQAQLPLKAQAFVPVLLERLNAYQAPYASEWFPLTEGMLQQQQKEHEAALQKHALERHQPILSPAVALSLPRPWFNRVLMTVKTLKLPKIKVLEMAYHVMHYKPLKTFSTLEERLKFNLCLAIRLIKDQRWTCPSGLESKSIPSQRNYL